MNVQKIKNTLLGAFVWAFFLASCGSKESRFEHVDKLRGLGVLADPLVTTPSQQDDGKLVTVKFWALMPIGTSVKHKEVYIDEESPYAMVMSQLTIDEHSEAYKDYGPLRLYELGAHFVVPSESQFNASLKSQASVRLRYGILLVSDDNEEKIIGDIVVVLQDSMLTNLQSPQIRIKKPSSAQLSIDGSKEIDLEAELTASDDDPVKIGWFVSSGTVQNRRARQTSWMISQSGDFTLVATAHGKRSRGFSFDILQVNVHN